MTRFEQLKIATALATILDEAVQNLATHDDLLALEKRLERRFAIGLGGAIIAVFVAMQVFHR